jgi:hypothetical protein
VKIFESKLPNERMLRQLIHKLIKTWREKRECSLPDALHAMGWILLAWTFHLTSISRRIPRSVRHLHVIWNRNHVIALDTPDMGDAKGVYSGRKRKQAPIDFVDSYSDYDRQSDDGDRHGGRDRMDSDQCSESNRSIDEQDFDEQDDENYPGREAADGTGKESLRDGSAALGTSRRPTCWVQVWHSP